MPSARELKRLPTSASAVDVREHIQRRIRLAGGAVLFFGGSTTTKLPSWARVTLAGKGTSASTSAPVSDLNAIAGNPTPGQTKLLSIDYVIVWNVASEIAWLANQQGDGASTSTRPCRSRLFGDPRVGMRKKLTIRYYVRGFHGCTTTGQPVHVALVPGVRAEAGHFGVIQSGWTTADAQEIHELSRQILIHAGPETRTKLSGELITLVARVHKLRFERHAAAERTRAIEQEQRARKRGAKGGCGLVRGYSCCELKDCCELDEAESCELATVHVKSTALEAVVV
ncbi:ubiquitin-protein transferase [Aureococcus anophagefferens]|nr:ubiquitin-protein transferase [Aureococcus anophagefferens]